MLIQMKNNLSNIDQIKLMYMSWFNSILSLNDSSMFQTQYDT